jgi:hypothetical protein
MSMEIDTAVRRHLLMQPGVVGYVGTKVFKNELLEAVDGTGGRAVVVRKNGGFSTPQSVNTDEFPSLVVDCWADCDRDPSGEIVVNNAIDKAYAVYRVVDALLGRLNDAWLGAGGTSPGVRVISSGKMMEPIHETSADAHGPTKMGDSAVVTAEYEFHIAP